MKELTVVYNERHPNFDLLQKDALGTLGVGVTAIFDFKPPCRVYPAGGIPGFNF